MITLITDWDWHTGASDTVAADSYDLKTVAIHEFGHLLGVGHNPDPDSPMHDTLGRGEDRRDVSAEEEAALAYLYDGALDDAGGFYLGSQGAAPAFTDLLLGLLGIPPDKCFNPNVGQPGGPNGGGGSGGGSGGGGSSGGGSGGGAPDATPVLPSPRWSAVTSDGTRVYVTIREASVAMLDAQMLRQVDNIDLPDGAVSFMVTIGPLGRYAYVGDENQARVYIIDIDPRSQQYNQVIHTIELTKEDARNGVRGLAVTPDNKFLFAAGVNSNRFDHPVDVNGMLQTNVPGNLIVVDLDADSPTYRTQIFKEELGIEPWDVQATSDPNVVLVTNLGSDSVGYGVVKIFESDPASFALDPMTPINYVRHYDTFRDDPITPERELQSGFGLGRLTDRFDVNSATGIALLPENALEDQIGEHPPFAFVAAWNQPRRDVPSADVNDFLISPFGVSIGGGNLAVIANPLSTDPLKPPEVVGATTSIPLNFPDAVLLSYDFKHVIMSARGQGAVYMFNTAELVKTAMDPAAFDAVPFSDLTFREIEEFNPLVDTADGARANFVLKLITNPDGSQVVDLRQGAPTFHAPDPDTAPIGTGGLPSGLSNRSGPRFMDFEVDSPTDEGSEVMATGTIDRDGFVGTLEVEIDWGDGTTSDRHGAAGLQHTHRPQLAAHLCRRRPDVDAIR